MSQTRTPWTPAENAAIVRLYFGMLDAAMAEQSYSKAGAIRFMQGAAGYHDLPAELAELRGSLADRSRGSIEAKLMNATAAHRDQSLALFGRLPHITMDGHGYRALSNYQAALAEAMAAELKRRATIRSAEGAA